MKKASLFALLCAISCGTDSQLFAQWQLRAITSQNVHALLTNAGSTYAGSDSGCYLSTDNGISWRRRSNGLPTSITFFPKTFALSGSNLFAGTNGGGGVYLTTDNGGSWGAANGGLGSTAVHALTFNGGTLLAGTLNGGVFRSTDNGGTWLASNAGLTSLAVHALLVTPGQVFAGADGGVFISTDGGLNWTLPSGSPLNVRGLAALGTDVFAATRFNGVYKSTDNGTTWTIDTVGMTSVDVRVVIEHNGSLFAGTGTSGVYLSTNAGASWSQINTGLANLSILSLAANATTLYAGTQVGGVWTRPLSQVVAVDEQRIIEPMNFTLGQNYPNPFNPATTIRYQIPTEGQVSLRVFDVLGREIASLVDEVKPAGEHSIVWGATSYPSGLYFYRLTSHGRIEVKSMLLLK